MEVKAEVNIHIHFPSDPGQGETLAAIREVKEIAMNLNDTLAELTADDAELAADVVAMVNIINDIPARIQAAVAGAMADAGVSDDQTRAALNAVDATVKDAIAAARAVLPTPPHPSVDPSGTNTVGAGAADDTISGGVDGNDTIGSTTTDPNAGSGLDGSVDSGSGTVTGANLSDSLNGGQGNDSITGTGGALASGNDTTEQSLGGAGTGDAGSGLGADTTGQTSSTLDTLSGGQGADTVTGGGSDPAASNATSAQTDPTTGAITVPPPSASSAS